MRNENEKKILWNDRKRTRILGLPWTFTKYILTKDILYVVKGLLSTSEDEVRLYRITDIRLTTSLWQKIIGTGTIHISSFDKNLGNFTITNIKDAKAVKDMLSEMVEHERDEHRVYARENAVDINDDDLDNDGIPDYLEK